MFLIDLVEHRDKMIMAIKKDIYESIFTNLIKKDIKKYTKF